MRKPLLLAALLLTAGAPAAAEPMKVAVVPFAPLSGEVPPKAGVKAASMLAGELKNVENMAPLEVALDPNEAAQKAVADAREAMGKAQELEKKRKFGQAADACRKAIAGYDAGASQLMDPTELSDAHALLATILYLTGDDANGPKELATAIGLTPTRELPGESTSPLFRAEVKKVKDRLFAEPKGSLRVESVPAAASVLLDGNEVGRTPLVLKDIPPGKHVWRVVLPTSEPVGGVVNLGAGKTEKLAATISGAGAVSQLEAALSSNKLDDKAVAAVAQIAKTQGADMLVFGALHPREQDLVFTGFLYSAAKNAVARLPEKTFDAELLSAGMQLFQLAGDIGARGLEAGKAEKAGVKVAVDAPNPELAQLTEVAYALPGSEAATDGKGGDDKKTGRRPIDKTQQKRVLRPR